MEVEWVVALHEGCVRVVSDARINEKSGGNEDIERYDFSLGDQPFENLRTLSRPLARELLKKSSGVT